MVWRWIVIPVLVVLAVLTALWVFQRSLIYLPSQATIGVADLPVEVAQLITEDGLTLTAWYVPAETHQAGAVLVFNGNAGNRSHRLPLAEALAASGYSTLLVDYRGYGGNPGDPSEEGLIRDARAALAYLESRGDIEPDRIAYFGESLGAGVAVALAAEQPPAALVLRSPFPSLPEVAAVHYPMLPVSLLLRDRYPSDDLISGIDVPLFVVIGSADTIVPPELSTRLYDAATEPKDLVVIEGAGHNDPALLAGPEMVEEIVSFLDETIGGR